MFIAKYRGWSITQERFVYGEIETKTCILEGHTCYEVYPETISMWSGMLDDQGKEIYEGDKLCAILDGWGESESVYLFTFKEGTFCVKRSSSNSHYPLSGGKWVIKGNIWSGTKIKRCRHCEYIGKAEEFPMSYNGYSDPDDVQYDLYECPQCGTSDSDDDQCLQEIK